MKKLLVIPALLTALFSGGVFSQSAIIRGEVSPGVYVNIKSDALGNLSAATTSGTITTIANATVTVTNAAQNLTALNATRKYLQIQNNDAAGNIFVNLGGVATLTNGIKIGPGQTWAPYIVSGQAVSYIGSIASNGNVVVSEGN